MSQAETHRWAGDHDAAELSEYRSVSKLAVVALILGIASALAWIGPYAWAIPVVALCVSLISLARINRPALGLSGRKAAIGGLCLALIFGIGAPTRYYTYRYLVQREGLQFAMQWFEHIRNGDVEYAHQMAVPITQRQPTTDDLSRFYREHPQSAAELRVYADSALVRTLLELGDRANVRIYHRFGVSVSPLTDELLDEFAVTYEENGEKKTFFLYVLLERHFNSFSGRGHWRISDIRVGKPTLSLNEETAEADAEETETPAED